MSTTPSTPRSSKRRHPSAGNLDARPSLVAEPDPSDDSPVLAFPFHSSPTTDRPRVAPGMDPESERKLFGHLSGRRVLELGCGTGSNAVAMALAGAQVISVDTSVARLGAARRLAEEHDVRVEFHHGDLADLPFVRADQIDFAVSNYALAEIADVSRVFRQVHRVIRPESSLLVSLPHPLMLMIAGSDPRQPSLKRSAFDASTVSWEHGDISGTTHPHRIADVVVALSRANFRVDLLLEPEWSAPEPGMNFPFDSWTPASFVVRGRKEGS